MENGLGNEDRFLVKQFGVCLVKRYPCVGFQVDKFQVNSILLLKLIRCWVSDSEIVEHSHLNDGVLVRVLLKSKEDALLLGFGQPLWRNYLGINVHSLEESRRSFELAQHENMELFLDVSYNLASQFFNDFLVFVAQGFSLKHDF